MTDPEPAEAVRAEDDRAHGSGAFGDWFDRMFPDPEAWAEQFRAQPVTGHPVVVPAGEPLAPLAIPAVEEGTCLETAAERARKITSMLNTGEIGPGLPPGYRFDFTCTGTREAEAWFPKQVRGTAPEPPPDGFLVPPGFAEDLRDMIMDVYGLPRGLFARPAAPLTRRQRLRRKLRDWRTRAARRAYKIIDGYWPDNGEDDW